MTDHSTDTTDYEELLDLPNVVGVDVKPDGTVVALVSQKVDVDDLPADAVVSQHVDHDQTDVEDLGIGEEVDGISPEHLAADESDADGAVMPEDVASHRDVHRPIQTGLSEMHHSGGAATGGYFPARIDDLSQNEAGAHWSARASEGDIVRLSNNHVYAEMNSAAFESDILQPSPLDGGDPETNIAGHLKGYVELQDGVTVDVAARAADGTEETDSAHGLRDSVPKTVFRGDYQSLEGTRVCKSGRTTGVTYGEIRHTSASIRVRYGGSLGVVTLRDQLVSTDISNPGDSGSAVFTDDGAFIGQLFAGSSNATIINKAANIEQALGIKLVDLADGQP